MPEAVLRGGETLGEEQIGFGLCSDVGDAPGVAVDGDGVFEGWKCWVVLTSGRAACRSFLLTGMGPLLRAVVDGAGVLAQFAALAAGEHGLDFC